MNVVSPEAVAHSKNLQFTFSETMRNEPVELELYGAQANYVIDVNGAVYQGTPASEETATIVIIGGDDRFINEKVERLSSNFFYTEPQKITLYKIIRELAAFQASATITSDNDKLDQVLNALYKNYSR